MNYEGDDDGGDDSDGDVDDCPTDRPTFQLTSSPILLTSRTPPDFRLTSSCQGHLRLDLRLQVQPLWQCHHEKLQLLV